MVDIFYGKLVLFDALKQIRFLVELTAFNTEMASCSSSVYFDAVPPALLFTAFMSILFFEVGMSEISRLCLELQDLSLWSTAWEPVTRSIRI